MTQKQDQMTPALWRPGYSTPRDTLKFLPYVAAKKLSKGMKVTAKLLVDGDGDGGSGISSSDVYEVLIACRHLVWIDGQDELTEGCIELANATGAVYRSLLRECLRRAYAPIYMSNIDLAHASIQELRDLFLYIGYVPSKMVPKMVALFRGLYKESENINDHETPPWHDTEPTEPLRVKDVSTMEQIPAPSLNGLASKQEDAMIISLLDTLAVLRQIPSSPGWTESTRKSWRNAVAGHVNLLHALLERENSQ